MAQVDEGKPFDGLATAQACIEAAKTGWTPKSQIHALTPLLSAYLDVGQYHEILGKVSSYEGSAYESGLLTQYRFELIALFELGQISKLISLITEFSNRATSNQYIYQDLQGGDYVHTLDMFACSVEIYRGNLERAEQHALNILKVRDYPFFYAESGPAFCRWNYETEALVRTGHITEAKTDIEKRRPHVLDKPRYYLIHLRSEAVLDNFEGRHAEALEKLQEALAIATNIGLPGEKWQLEVEIAQTLETLGKKKKAREARARAVEIVQDLASMIPDDDMRKTYLEFTQARGAKV